MTTFKFNVTNVLVIIFLFSTFNIAKAQTKTVAQWVALAKSGQKNLIGANLTGADLQNIDLSGVDLTKANLTVRILQTRIYLKQNWNNAT